MMCECLVRVVDKVNATDLRKHAQLTKRGDVIVVQDDGWQWSTAELAGNPWVVIKVPGVDAAVASAYLLPEPEDLAVHKILQRRAFYMDVDAWIAMGSPSTLTRAQVLALKKSKPVIPDPDVLA